jgi:RNA polymerase sigma-70 factor, ECF subfamily
MHLLYRNCDETTLAIFKVRRMPQHTNPEKTFAILVDKYLDRVFRYLRNLTRDEDLSQDLTQETFLRLRGKIAPGHNLSEAYVFTTARNTALSALRSKKYEEDKRASWGEEFDHQQPPPSVEQLGLGEALAAALGSLSEDHRTVFLLSEVEGLKYQTIAEIMNISAGTVASRKFHAVRVLRGELSRSGHALP